MRTCLFLLLAAALTASAIDRRALVERHVVVLAKADPMTPLQAGNGEFAFSADITGLQTFPEFHEAGMPLGTMSQWGWHSFPNPEQFRLEEVYAPYDSHGRRVPYPDQRGDTPATERVKRAVAWLRANPHRLHLGRAGLILQKGDGAAGRIADLSGVRQTLDLWNGLLESRFEFEGRPVRVLTVCHPVRDLLAVRVESPLIADKRLGLRLAFPYASGDWRNAEDWSKPERHQTTLSGGVFSRVLDETRYFVATSGPAPFAGRAAHEYVLFAPGGQAFDVVLEFRLSREGPALPQFEAARNAAAQHWQRFWSSGGAIDLSRSRDPRAKELERRIVLSQYLTAIQCSGSVPPQETGLATNSWHGKFHLEMHWWHAAHFALWGRLEMLERSLPWYEKILPAARATAKLQGYRGARWPKMVGLDGRESPSDVGVFLIWQQPHPIFYAELLYRARPDRRTLERYRQLVFESAEFMASYAHRDEGGKRYVLGPPLIPAQESYGHERRTVMNPAYELAYWHWGLETAQKWRTRLGMERDPEWDKILAGLSPAPVRNGLYAAIETEPYTVYGDHPSMLAAYGILPKTPLIDPGTMARTLDDVRGKWDWASTWGWDYPMMAMTAARVGEPHKAIEALFVETPKNRYLTNGHNFQRMPTLPLYLPGNGGLLYAAAMMAAGWDGGPDKHAPGYPADGSWTVEWEGLKKAP